MKSSLAVVAAATLVTVSLVGCTRASESPTGGQSAGTGTSSAQKSVAVAVSQDAKVAALVPKSWQGKTLSIATDASYPPFEYMASDNHTIIGFDADFAMAVVDRMGLKGKLVNTSFDSILTGLAAKRYDMALSSFSITPERKKIVDMVTYMQGGAGIGVMPGNPLHLAMDPMKLCGHKIATQKGTTQAIEQLPKISKECTAAGKPAVTIDLFPSSNEAVLALTSGRDEGMMADTTAIKNGAKLSGGKFELAPGKMYEPRPTGIALTLGSTLEPAVSAAVKSLYADGTVKKLVAKWSLPDGILTATPGA